MTPQQMKALIKKLQKENLELRLNGGNLGNDEIVNNYQERNEELEAEIEKLKDKIFGADDGKEDEEDGEKQELSEQVERLNAEIDNLQSELEVSDQGKRYLAVMNGLWTRNWIRNRG
eukprot:TRINITY_DN5823_c0_g1_i1.p1 TRINITY_DN5823_c0_g1~~TRINITY_DN5823_c0_g1_i1.p1  ORF type:complete len:117 (-),score=22.32 TRINITY_DN5823_c0_g1_i1:27-377(-)